MVEYEVGMRVLAVEPDSSCSRFSKEELKGFIGTITELDNYADFNLYFDNPACSGCSENGTCCWSVNEVVPYYEHNRNGANS